MVALSSSDILSRGVQLGFGIFLIVALVVGALGNLMTLYVIITRRKLRTTTNVFVANLAVADLVLLLVNLPTNSYEFLSGENNSSKSYCKYTSPIQIMTMICSLTSVAAVGMNRFILLCKTKGLYNKLTKKSSLAITLAAIWVWSFLIVLPPMVGYGEFGYHVKFHTCFFPAYNEKSWMYGTIFCCMLGVFPPVLLSTFFYARILIKLKQNRLNLMSHYLPPIKSITGNVASKDPAFITQEPNNKEERQKRKKKENNALLLRQNAHHKRSTLMLITVFACIVICWLPISISFMADKENKLPSVVYVCFVTLAWVNSCINMFIYAGMNLQFRKAYKSMLTSPFRWNNESLVTMSQGIATDMTPPEDPSCSATSS